ncbi:Apaf-1S, partial [Operophtera brumata]
MDFKSRLQRQYPAIVQDLDVKYILDELYQKNVFTNSDFSHIVNVTSREEQVRFLLDNLIQYGTVATFDAFVDSLAKDYGWLYEKLIGNHEPIMDDSFEDSLSKGDERTVAEKLRQLKRHKILVLLGMSGSGKSCVAISALRDNPDLITNDFNGVVLWLNMGNCKTDDDIIVQQMNIGSNGDNSLSNLDWTWRDLKDRLKTQFLEQTLKECLLVLDEVNDRQCLEALDIGCKILITTRDTEVVANYDAQIVKIENNLEKEESLKIFASCLDETVFLTRPNANPMKAIEFCINALNDNLLQCYKKLAILPDNVKVSAKVLGKLWNRDIPEVNSFMKQLKGKSLIIESYDREQRNYLYEVHDIIMSYLRTRLNDDEKQKIHDLFLNSYNYARNSAPVEILDDGYIAFHVGYHILNTRNLNDKWRLFRKLFLDLKFLGNKVRLTGPADFFDIPTNKLKKELFENETSRGVPVKWIGVAYSKNPPIVAVLFSGGVLKLWYIDDIDQDNDEDVIEEEPEEIYNNNIPGTMIIKSTLMPIIKCNWTTNEDYLIAQTADMIILYLPTGDVVNVIDNFERNVRLLCSVPCRSSKIITLKHREVTQHEFKINPNTIKKCNTCKTRTIITSYDVKETLVFLSMAVNKTGTLLFISTDDSRVICSFANHKEVKKALKCTLSLKPLNLKGICNNNEGSLHPLLAVIDDKNNIQ